MERFCQCLPGSKYTCIYIHGSNCWIPCHSVPLLFSLVGVLWRTKQNTIDAILIQWDANKWQGILQLSSKERGLKQIWRSTSILTTRIQMSSQSKSLSPYNMIQLLANCVSLSSEPQHKNLVLASLYCIIDLLLCTQFVQHETHDSHQFTDSPISGGRHLHLRVSTFTLSSYWRD